MVEYIIGINGMSRSGCENILRQELTRLPGISDASPNSDRDEVVIYGDLGMEDRVRQAVAEAGYDPME